MIRLIVAMLRSLFHPRSALLLENLALRHQLAILNRSTSRPRLKQVDRILWVWFSRIWKDCRRRESIEFRSTDEESASQILATNLIRAYLENVPPDEPKTLGAETPLEADLIDPINGENLGIQLMGIIDLVQDSPDGPVIVDFKTAARATAPSPLAHELQLSAYSYLFRQVTGLQESHLEIRQLIKTKTPKIAVHVFPPRTDEDFERFFELVKEYLAAIRRRQFNYRPSWNCGMCEFAQRCCS